MAKTLQFTTNVHLSEKFGGIKHGEKLPDENPEIARDTILDIANEKLAAHLINKGFAKEIRSANEQPVKASKPSKKGKENKENEGGEETASSEEPAQ